MEKNDRINQAYQYFYEEFKGTHPEFAEHFKNFWKRKKEDRVFPYKYMEFLRLLAGLLQDCKPCIEKHIKSALENGASKEEIYEILSIYATMSGSKPNENITFVLYLLKK
ncbi:MAG: carboxymuconolactone decarboxylase family protein [bacterium]|nr:carboxymuconolactone decarboxylase family protein [bacterium]